MKKVTSLLLITGLLFIALFGLLALEYGMGHRQPNCAVSLMSSASCPINIVSLMNHHVSAIQSLFSVPLSVFFFSIILLVAVSTIWFAYLFKFLLLRSQFLTQRLRDYRLTFNFAKHRFISWLSLFEHSPSF